MWLFLGPISLFLDVLAVGSKLMSYKRALELHEHQ